MSRIVAIVAIALSAPAFAEKPDPLPATQLELAPGARRTLHLAHLERIAIGDPAVADAEPKGDDGLVVKGVKPGKTEMQVWAGRKRHRYQITVR